MGRFWIWCWPMISAVFVMARGGQKEKEPYNVLCYLNTVASYRSGEGKFLIEDIDPTLCTHLIYAFAKLDPVYKIVANDPLLDLKERGYRRFTGLKSVNPRLKTLLGIGGWNDGTARFSHMADSSSLRQTFIKSVVELLTRYNFDGLDIDWEYPVTLEGTPANKESFVLLLKELKQAFKEHSLMITAAVSAGTSVIDAAYDVPALGKYLDLISLMSYDFHGDWDNVTGYNSPLFARPEQTGKQRTFNVDYAVRSWISRGAPADKLVLGMPLYGRSFALRDSRQYGFNASIIPGKGLIGEFTKQPGFIGYNELCKMFQSDKEWQMHVDIYALTLFAVKNKQWISYDDVSSISLKTEYLIKMQLAGAMVWSLDTDDFRGNCHGYRYPLLQAINSVLNIPSNPLPDLNVESSIFQKTTRSVISSESSKTTPDGLKANLLGTSDYHTENIFNFPPSSNLLSTTPEALELKPELLGSSDNHPENNFYFSPTSNSLSTTPEVISHTPRQLDTTDNPRDHSFNCPNAGYFRYEEDCKYFYVCRPAPLEFEQEFLVYLFSCASGTVFNQENRVCDYSVNVPECTKN